MEKLKNEGWLIDAKFINEAVNLNSYEDIFKFIINIDIKDFGSAQFKLIQARKSNLFEGPSILQISKIHNVLSPLLQQFDQKSAKEPLLKITLTDGHNICFGLVGYEMKDKLPNKISLKTPPGTKVQLNGSIRIENGFLLFNYKNIVFIGGRVQKLIDKWEMSKQSDLIIAGSNSGSPKWVPFRAKSTEASDFEFPLKNTHLTRLMNVEKKQENDKNPQFEAKLESNISQVSNRGDFMQKTRRKFADVHVQVQLYFYHHFFPFSLTNRVKPQILPNNNVKEAHEKRCMANARIEDRNFGRKDHIERNDDLNAFSARSSCSLMISDFVKINTSEDKHFSRINPPKIGTGSRQKDADFNDDFPTIEEAASSLHNPQKSAVFCKLKSGIPQWKSGCKCLAPWTDGKYYLATVISNDDSNMCTINYSDHNVQNVLPKDVLIMPQFGTAD